MKRKPIPYEECHKEINGILHKQCSICGEWLPCNTEYFYKNNGSKLDGVCPYCKKCNIKKSHEYQVTNREHYNEYKKNQYTPDQRPYYREISRRSRENGNLKRWQENNPNKLKEYNYKRQHKNHNINKKEWDSCKEYFNNECAYCGLPLNKHFNMFKGELRLTDLHKEHVVHEGMNDLSNCIPSCKKCNSSKHTDKLEYWYTEGNPVYNKDRLDKIHKWLSEDWKLYYIEKKPRKPYTRKEQKEAI